MRYLRLLADVPSIGLTHSIDVIPPMYSFAISSQSSHCFLSRFLRLKQHFAGPGTQQGIIHSHFVKGHS